MTDQEILMLLALGFILVVGGGSAVYFVVSVLPRWCVVRRAYCRPGSQPRRVP